MASERSVTRDDSGESILFIEADGEQWEYVTDDACGNYAVNQVELRNAGMVVGRSDGTYDLYHCGEGAGFSAGNPDELIVRDGTWVDNTD